VHKLNSYLPKDIVVYDIIPVPDEALVLMRPNELTSTISTLSKIRFLQEQSWYFSSAGCQFDE
jgi:tRNA pseudouridine38-40 synthase